MTDARSASIVINNFNYGRFLADAIESALSQTHENTEVIVVDDGSTDDSAQIMQRYATRIVAIYKQNGGQASAFNAGFNVSRGDVVCFLDSDDTLNKSTVEQALVAFQDPHVLKVEWQLQIVDTQGTPTGDIVPARPLPEADLRQQSILNGPYYDWWFTPPSSGNCYSRQFLNNVMPVPEQPFRHGADVYLTVLAPIYGGIHRLPEPQGTYRIHEQNNYFGRTLDSRRILDYVQRFENCCVELQKHLGMQGIDVDVDDWRKRNFNYLWPSRLLQALSELNSVLPHGGSYILVDDEEWGNEQPVPGCQALPFLERDGEYWGPPADDASAISQVDRLRREKNAAHLVFSWTAYWWLDHYKNFNQWLRSRFKCILENERLTVFDIR